MNEQPEESNLNDPNDNQQNSEGTDYKQEGEEKQASPTNDSESLSAFSKTNSEIEEVMKVAESIRNELRKVIIGQENIFNLLLISLLTKGHVLIEGVPGIAKTLMARMFARTINSDFSRLQFTPDLMPSDILGTNIFNVKSSDFEFKRGPVFTDILLVDEINRAPAKTQSALFEVMQERQVTIDGVTYLMGDSYLVIATQNPIDQEGTYQLPEAQMDRFLFKIIAEHPSLDEEVAILERYKQDFDGDVEDEVKGVLSDKDIERFQDIVESVRIESELLKYIAEIVHQTRNNGDIHLGASPRASLSIMKASKAQAALNGRNFVIPDDIRDVAYPVLRHRIILSAERELEGASTADVIAEIIQKVEVPR